MGNALGSNIANVGLILGCTAVVSPLAFKSNLLKRQLPLLMIVSFVCYFLAFDGLSVVGGVLMLIMLVVFLIWLIWGAKKEKNNSSVVDPLQQELLDKMQGDISEKQAWIYFSAGLIGLVLSSRLLVWAAVNIAECFGMSDLVIGLTIVALGTSLPKLAAYY